MHCCKRVGLHSLAAARCAVSNDNILELSFTRVSKIVALIEAASCHGGDPRAEIALELPLFTTDVGCHRSE